MNFLLRWLIRAFSPCPLYHRTPERIRRHDEGRVFYDCVLCGRQTSQALKDLPKGVPIPPLTAVKHGRVWRKAG